MNVDYNELIPPKILFSLREIEELGLIKVSTMKKLLYLKQIEHVKVGSKSFVARTEIIRYLNSRTVKATN